jgi:hypothetical protein
VKRLPFLPSPVCVAPVRCLNLFSGLYGTTEVVPFPDRDGKRNPSDIKRPARLAKTRTAFATDQRHGADVH